MKLLARTRAGAKSRTRIRVPWKLTLLGLPVILFFGVVLFYAIWAQTFDLKKVDDMPERTPSSTSTAKSTAASQARIG
jgi:hypothetical protein